MLNRKLLILIDGVVYYHLFIFREYPNQGLNLGLPQCRQILYNLSYQGSPAFSNLHLAFHISSVQSFSHVRLCDPMNLSTPGLAVHHQFLEFTQTHVHRDRDAIQPSHPLLSPFPPALNTSQLQGLFQWVKSSHEVAKVLEFQLQH